MTRVRAARPPAGALIGAYQDRGYTDGFARQVPGSVPLAALIEAFFESAAFLPERAVLLGIGRAGTRDSLAALATGAGTSHAAWRAEARREREVLLCDFLAYTRCWLATEPLGEATRLWFGTAIVARRTRRDGTARLTRGFQALIPFHRPYARALLAAAAGRVAAQNRACNATSTARSSPGKYRSEPKAKSARRA